MKRTIVVLSLLAPLALAACHESSDSAVPPPPPPPSPAEQLAQLEQEGKLPTLDRSMSIAGTDADGNGVRDDVDQWLAQRFADPQQRAAATQMAKAVQAAVLVDGTNPASSKAVSQQLGNAMHCLFARFHGNDGDQAPAAVGEEIEAVTANTKPRLLAYLAYNKSRDGTASSLPKGDTCD